MVSKNPPVEVLVTFEEGSLGLSVEDSSYGYCIVTDIAEGGQAETLGLFPQDRVLEVAGTKIERGDNSYDDALALLKSCPRPFTMLIQRDVREIRVSLNPGPLGLSLAEIDNKKCMVSGLKNGGQCDQIGLEEGDTVYSIGGNLIPDGATAYDTVVNYLKNLPRPIEMIVLREGY